MQNFGLTILVLTLVPTLRAQADRAEKPVGVAAPAAPLVAVPRAVVPSFVDEVLLIEREADRRGRDALACKIGVLRVSLVAEELPVKDLAVRLSAACGDVVNFAVITKGESSGLPTTTLTLTHRLMPTILHAVQRTTDLRFVYRAGLVQIKPKDEVRELRILQTYDLTAAVAPLRDKPGPKLGLRAPGEEASEAPEVDDEKTLSGLSMDRVTQLVEAHVTPDSWDEEGVSLRAWRGVLFVRQTERNQAKVRRLLEELGVLPRRIRRVIQTRAPRLAKKARAPWIPSRSRRARL